MPVHSHLTFSDILPWLLPASCLLCSSVIGQREWTPWDPDREIDPWRDPPWGKPGEFDDRVAVRTYYGDVRGFSIPWHIYDLNWNERYESQPPWYTRRINCFLGLPYAEPPLGKLRFKRPKPPRWGGTWEAQYYRPSCPQNIETLREDIPDLQKANMSEDCLYMNIFVPNITWHSQKTLYPVMLMIHSGDFVSGSGQLTPGHVLATREVVVVTFNYRLGAFGFLTTEDEYSSGNYGLFDQHRAIEFVKENIRAFKGDPTKITIMGDGAGAVSVGMHLLSPMTRGKNFFHQTIMMSGTDLSRYGFVNPYWQPRDYAIELGRRLDCPTHDTYVMVECLRDNKTIKWEQILDAQNMVKPKDGKLGLAWGPTQDGGWYQRSPYLPQTPIDMRYIGEFDALPSIIGLNTQDGSKIANKTFGWRALESGIFKNTLRTFIEELLVDWNTDENFIARAVEAIEFQYTWWAEPDNRTAQTQELFNLITDLNYGVAMDEVVKLNSKTQPTYMYQFNYKSWSDWLPKWMGVGFSAAVPYVFGFPFMNETILNQTELIARQHFDYEDRNMSDWMMYMWTNFAKYGYPTPNITYNITWDPFNAQNLSFLQIEEHSHIWFRYRQNKYSFWRDYFPEIAKQVPYFPTPTPAGYEYVIATGSLTALMILLVCGVIMLGYLHWWHSQRQKRLDEYRSADIPLSFMSSRMGSQAQMIGPSSRSVSQSQMTAASRSMSQSTMQSQLSAQSAHQRAQQQQQQQHPPPRGASPGYSLPQPTGTRKYPQHSVC